jgi:hypothetical protein
MRRLAILVALASVCTAVAQQSPSYNLEEHVINGGGRPEDGEILTSASYRVTFDGVGEAVLETGMTSASFQLSAGFVATYPPPGEVLGLTFPDKQTLVWNPETSAGTYNLYRDLMSGLTGGGYGNCEQQNLLDVTTTDGEVPPGGDGYFYLVTVENRLSEEGTKGWDSGGAERPNPSPCP